MTTRSIVPRTTDRHLPTSERALALLRRGWRTVEYLADALGVTRNAVRAQLSVLERDGLVERTGFVSTAKPGKPPQLYGLTVAGQQRYAVAYPLVLGALVAALTESMPRGGRRRILSRAGRRLAQAQAGNHAESDPRGQGMGRSGRTAARTSMAGEGGGIGTAAGKGGGQAAMKKGGAEIARALLESLGGSVVVGDSDALGMRRRVDSAVDGRTDPVTSAGPRRVVRGLGCPLAAAVREAPETCDMVCAMLAEATGEPVRMRCDHGDEPSCRFEIG